MESQQVTIDMGGEKTFRVNADLFSLAGDNKYAAMLSDRWQGKGGLKDDCSMFVDYSPKVFMPLIEWLRLIRDSEPEMTTPVIIDPPHLTAWIRMMIASAFHPQVFRKANLTGKDLCMAGCSLRLCIEAGLGPDCFRNYFPCHWPFKVSELKDSGFTAAELRDAGFTDVTLLARAGFSTSELEAAGFDRHEAAASAGFTARESFEASIAAAGAAGYDRPPVKAPPTLWPKGGPKGMRMQPGLPFFLKGKGKGPLGPMGMGPSMGPTLIHGGSDSLWGQFSPSSSQFPPPTKPPPPRPSWLDANSDHMFGDLLDSEGSG